MYKIFKYRLMTTPAQEAALWQLLDACRWTYNNGLKIRRDAWKNEHKALSCYDTFNMLPKWKQEHEWLRRGHSQAMQEALRRLDLAFQAFFRRVRAGEKPGYPRFKGRERYNSFTYPRQRGNWSFLPNGRLRISKVGDVEIKLHCPLEGQCKTLTLHRNGLGNWYACFSCVVETKPLPPVDQFTGVDVGISHFITLANGEQVDNPRFFQRDERALAKAQRQLSGAPKDTPRQNRYLRTVRHIHQRIANRRKDFAHKLARRLVNEYQVIALEDLNIAGMLRNHYLAKAISDAAWGKLTQYIQDKAEEAGRTVVLVDPRNTSQLCSRCGTMVNKALSVRIHECSCCGLVMDRDQNAALNILARGLASVGGNP
jgi:putative transposase